MSPTTQNILQWALALPEVDRATIADRLLESIAPDREGDGTKPTLHPEWEAEIAARVAAIDNGTARMTSWDEVNREAQEIVDRAQTH